MSFMTPMGMLCGGAAGGLPPSTWNPLDKGPDVVLSNNNMTATGPSSPASTTTRSTTGTTSGKNYCEIMVANNNGSFGIVTSAVLNTTTAYGPSTAIFFQNGNISNKGTISSGFGAPAAGDVFGIALDHTGNTVSFYKNGTLLSTQSGLPSGALFIACNANGPTTSFTLTTAQSGFAYAIPSGFTARG